jgi:hypothetical protein
MVPQETSEAREYRKPSLEILEIGHLQDLLAHFATAAHVTVKRTSQEKLLAPKRGKRR